MQAVILANEWGEALGPSGENTPKAAVRVLGRPVISYVTQMLFFNGVDSAAVYSCDKNSLKAIQTDLKLNFFSSNIPLNNGGALNACREYINETFILVSGGQICDFSLEEALSFHRRKKALATVVTVKSKKFTEQQALFSDISGKIKGAVQSPFWLEAEDNKINTGIYIFEKEILSFLPKGDFSLENELIPSLAARHLPVYEYSLTGYWNPLKSIEDYKACCFDILQGRVGVAPIMQKRARQSFRGAWPYYVGQGCVMEKGVSIGPFAVVGNNCTVGKNARLENCIIGDNTLIGEGAFVSGVVGSNANLKAYCKINKKSMVGNRCIIGRGSVIENACIASGEEVDSALRVEHSDCASFLKGLFCAQAIEGSAKIELTPVFAARLGAALGECFKGEVIVGFSGNRASLLAGVLACSMGAKGVSAAICNCAVNELRYALVKNKCAGVYILGENNISLWVFSQNGCSVSYAMERKILCELLKEQQFLSYAEPYILPNISSAYLKRVGAVLGKTNRGILAYGSTELCNIFNSCIANAGGCCKEGMEVELFPNGTDFTVKEEGINLSRFDILALICLFEKEKRLPLPEEMPLYIINRIGVEPIGENNAYEKYPYFYDSIFSVARLINIMEKENASLKELYMRLPRYHISKRKVACRSVAGAIALIRAVLPSADSTPAGISINADTGVVNIMPLFSQKGFEVCAYSTAAEMSEELCGDMCDILKSIDIS